MNAKEICGSEFTADSCIFIETSHVLKDLNEPAAVTVEHVIANHPHRFHDSFETNSSNNCMMDLRRPGLSFTFIVCLSWDGTFICSSFCSMSCNKSMDFPHSSHLLQALMAALNEITFAWTPKCQISARSSKACCHFSHFSQAVMAALTATKL